MSPAAYQKLTARLNTHPGLKRAVIFTDRWLPALPFVCYPVLLALLFARGLAGGYWGGLLRAVAVPGFAFCFGTFLRKKLNFSRPYEQSGFEPLVKKATHGQSFPSRHALSAAVLAMAWLRFYPAAGCVMAAAALIICVLRVITGVHYVRDVAAGAALGAALGLLMWV